MASINFKLNLQAHCNVGNIVSSELQPWRQDWQRVLTAVLCLREPIPLCAYKLAANSHIQMSLPCANGATYLASHTGLCPRVLLTWVSNPARGQSYCVV